MQMLTVPGEAGMGGRGGGGGGVTEEMLYKSSLPNGKVTPKGKQF